MSYKRLLILILGLIVLATAAVLEFFPGDLYFPVVEYVTPEKIKIALFKNGESDQSSCEQSVHNVVNAVRVNCPTCKVVDRCMRGLDAERKKILSQEPLGTPSARLPGGKLTMTISAEDPQLALVVCQQVEQQTATQPVDQRLRCFPALVAR